MRRGGRTLNFKKTILKILLFLLLCTPAWSIHFSDSLMKPPLGRVPYWPAFQQPVFLGLFNEGAGSKVYDLSGNGNNGAFSGVSWINSIYGSSIDFPSGDHFINCGHGPSLDITGEITIIVRFCSTDTEANVTLVGKEGKNSYWLCTFSDASLQFFTGGTAANSSVGKIADNVWVTAAVTRKDSEDRSKFYFDGVFDVSSVTGGNIASNPANDLYFGVDPRDETGIALIGAINYVQIYNRALTASEIAYLYRNPWPWFAPRNEWWGGITVTTAGGQIIIIMR